MDELRQFHEALATVRDAESLAWRAMKTTFPIGATVYYEHGENLIKARVIEHHRFSCRLIVHGANSGKRYWIDATRIKEVERPTTQAQTGGEQQ